jgi:DNA-binding transcriptional regulator GbsR (MarR family)
MKMFKSVWAFFFSGSDSGASKETKKLEDKIEKVEEKIEKAKETPKTPEAAKEKLNNVKAKVKKVIATSEDHAEVKKAEELLTRLDALVGKAMSEQMAGVDVATKYMGSLTGHQRKILKIVAVVKKELAADFAGGPKTKAFKNHDNHIIKDFVKFGDETVEFINGVQHKFQSIDTTHMDAGKALTIFGMVKGLKKDATTLLSKVIDRKSHTEKMVKDLEAKIKADNDKQELKEDLEAASAILHDLTKAVKAVDCVLTAGHRLLDIVESVIG